MEKIRHIQNIDIERAFSNNHLMAHCESVDGMNPNTIFNKETPILFGIGAGGRELSKGLPLDVLSMILTAENLRNSLGLGRCKILCADDAAALNLNMERGFTLETTGRVMEANRRILQLTVEQLGISDHFDIFLGSQIESLTRNIIDTKSIDNPYFALETAQMYYLIGQENGGIKVGWFNRKTTNRDKKPVLDEIPFDEFYRKYCRENSIPDVASFTYVKAGLSLKPDHNSEARKECPYTTYDPENRLLLHPDENVFEKLTQVLNKKDSASNTIKKYYTNLLRLFEEVIIGKTPFSLKGSLPERVQLIIKKIFDGRENEARELLIYGYSQ